MKFHYYSVENADRSTVVLTHDGSLLEIRRGSVTGPGRRFQTVEEWIMRMRGQGTFVIPDRTIFGADAEARGPHLLLKGVIRYRNPEYPQENCTLVWWTRNETWFEVAHGESRPRRVVTDLCAWIAALPTGGHFIFSDTEHTEMELLSLYSDMYEWTRWGAEAETAAHYFANFLHNNADVLAPVVAIRSGLAQDIQVFLNDAKFVYNNLILDIVKQLYFPPKAEESKTIPAIIMSEVPPPARAEEKILKGPSVEKEKAPTDETTSVETPAHFCARFRAGLKDSRFITDAAFRNGLLVEQMLLMKEMQTLTIHEMLAVHDLANEWSHELGRVVLDPAFSIF